MRNKATLLLMLILATGSAHSQVSIEGSVSDCGQWVAARKTDRAMAFEHYALGILAGMSMATNKEFWRAKGTNVSREAVYLWIDNYCQSHPLDSIVTGVNALFRERSGWQF